MSKKAPAYGLMPSTVALEAIRPEETRGGRETSLGAGWRWRGLGLDSTCRNLGDVHQAADGFNTSADLTDGSIKAHDVYIISSLVDRRYIILGSIYMQTISPIFP